MQTPKTNNQGYGIIAFNAMNATNAEFIPDCYKKPILVLGCGDILFGDGFGPAVVKCLQGNYTLSEDVAILDSGTGADS